VLRTYESAAASVRGNKRAVRVWHSNALKIPATDLKEGADGASPVGPAVLTQLN
jgi:hypothetical protein